MSQLTRAADAARKLAQNSHLRAAVAQVQSVADAVSTSYTKTLEDNSKYVVKDEKQKAELAKTAFFTSMAEIPLVAQRSRAEAAEWWVATSHTLKNFPSANAGSVAAALIFAVDIAACFKVGEFVGRGCTIFGYWP